MSDPRPAALDHHQRAARAALGLAVEVPAILLGLQGGVGGAFGWAFAAVAVLATRVGGRVRPPTWALAPLHLVLAVLTLVIYAALLRPGRPTFGAGFTLGCLAMAAPALLWRLRPAGRAVVLGVALVALMGLARAATRPAFAAAVAAFLLLGLLSALLADPAWRGLFLRPRGRLLPLLAGLGLAGGLMGGLGVLLPAAEPAVSAAIRGALFDDQVGTSGFGEGAIRLGELRSILTSDKVVLRVHGDLDHLRGQVYVDYAFGLWNGRRRPEAPVPVVTAAGAVHLARPEDPGSADPEAAAANLKPATPKPRPDARPVRVEALAGAGRPAFAPLAAAALGDLPPDARADAFGVVLQPAYRAGDDVVYTVTPGDPDLRLVAPPDDRDRLVPAQPRATLLGLAEAWTVGATTPAAQLEALAARLRRDYTYRLDLDAVPTGVDPVVYFLTQAKGGHCEYFASAFALLARSLGHPARVVGGYRVFEFNPAGGYHIVRQRDAHAWVEVFVAGAWRTYDPTPPGALEGESRRESGYFGARWDVLRRSFDQAFEWLAALTFDQLMTAALAVGLGVLAWLALRWRPRRRPRVPPVPGFAPLQAVEGAVARRGGPVRGVGEALSPFAARLRVAGHPAEAALVEACAAWLYGGEGDPAALAQAAGLASTEPGLASSEPAQPSTSSR